MKASRSAQLLNSRQPAINSPSRQLVRFAIGAAICSLVALSSPAASQSTNFANTQKTVTLPKGSKVDPRYLLRRKKPVAESDQEKEEPIDPVEQAKEKLGAELDALLLGAWTRVASVTKKLTGSQLKSAGKRCFQQLKLKPLKFETTAAQTLPDIDALFGDLVYYRTDKGLQRLDINSGQIRLVTDFTTRQIKNSQIVWTLTGQNLSLRIRFAKPLPKATKVRFMIEESGFYLRCPSNKDELFQAND